MVHRAGETAGALRTELRLGDLQFLLAAADGFISGCQFLLSQGFQGLHRQLHQAVGVTGVDVAGVGKRCCVFLLPTVAVVGPQATTGGHHASAGCAQPGERLTGDLGASCAAGDRLRKINGGLDEVAFNKLCIGGVVGTIKFSIGPLLASLDAKQAFIRSYRVDEHVATTVGGQCLLCPGIRVRPVKGVEEHHEDLPLFLSARGVDGLFDGGDIRPGQGAGVIGDPLRIELWCLG